jgi:hypothetical protein
MGNLASLDSLSCFMACPAGPCQRWDDCW